VSADARLFAITTSDGLFVFDALSGEQKLKLKNEGGGVSDAAFSPDNKALLVAHGGKGRLVRLPKGGQQVVRDDPTVALYDTASGKVRHRQTVPCSWIGPVTWRPDGKRFAVAVMGSPECYVRFYESGGRPVGRLDLPSRPWAVSYSPDGRRVIVSMADTTALVLDVPPEA
jgi:WD40 repeat protein